MRWPWRSYTSWSNIEWAIDHALSSGTARREVGLAYLQTQLDNDRLHPRDRLLVEHVVEIRRSDPTAS